MPWFLIPIIIVFILIFVLFLIFFSNASKNKFYKKIDELIDECLGDLNKSDYQWNNFINRTQLVQALKENIVDNRSGGYKIKPSVSNRGPVKMKEIKNLVKFWLEKDMLDEFKNAKNIINNFEKYPKEDEKPKSQKDNLSNKRGRIID